MLRFLVFAGTTEGRELLELLAGYDCDLTACVATEYGAQVLPPLPRLETLTGRLDNAEIAALLRQRRFDCVFDATHPYAAAVTENIVFACERTNTPYIRLSREQGERQSCVYVENTAAAADYLSTISGKVLLTTGSKELEAFTSVPDYTARLVVRVLPAADVMERCLGLGFAVKNIICMQGPFSEELNLAMLRQTGASCLVTKDSGDTGGFAQKCSAAHKAGAALVVIGRPAQAEDALSMREIPVFLREHFGLCLPAPESPAYFPLFLSLAGKTVVVVGAGRIAARRVKTLLDFGCTIRVIAPEAEETIEALAASEAVYLLRRGYERGDCVGAVLVVAATNSRACNQSVWEECTAEGILLSVADCAAQCSFYFPGVVKSGSVVVGVTASGSDHHLAKAVTEQIRNQLGKGAL